MDKVPNGYKYFGKFQSAEYRAHKRYRQNDDDDDDVQWFNVHLDWKPA